MRTKQRGALVHGAWLFLSIGLILFTAPLLSGGAADVEANVAIEEDEEDQYIYLPIVHRDLPGTLYTSADVDVLEGSPNTNFGDSHSMWVGYDHCVPQKVNRGLIWFDISAIPAGTSITQATLRLHLASSCDYANRSHTVQVYRTSGNWAEMSVTWNSKPAYAEAYGSTLVSSQMWGWYSFDVTGLVQGWVNGSFANQGLMLRGPESSGSSSARLGFYTRDNSDTTYDPHIVITYASTTSADVPEEQITSPAEYSPTAQDVAGVTLDTAEVGWSTFAADAASRDK
jgi:hypothetical protein